MHFQTGEGISDTAYAGGAETLHCSDTVIHGCHQLPLKVSWWSIKCYTRVEWKKKKKRKKKTALLIWIKLLVLSSELQTGVDQPQPHWVVQCLCDIIKKNKNTNYSLVKPSKAGCLLRHHFLVFTFNVSIYDLWWWHLNKPAVYLSCAFSTSSNTCVLGSTPGED